MCLSNLCVYVSTYHLCTYLPVIFSLHVRLETLGGCGHLEAKRTLFVGGSGAITMISLRRVGDLRIRIAGVGLQGLMA